MKIVGHPDSIRELIDALQRHDLRNPLGCQLATLGFPSIDMQFLADSAIERRRIRREWRPPADSRFCSYGQEDEHWMRPLGIGDIVEIDDGPALFVVDDQWSFAPVIPPRHLVTDATR